MRRERIKIIYDILKSIQNGNVKPTHILYKSNLSSQMLKEYLEELLRKGFIDKIEKKRKTRYSLKEKGHKYIQDFHMIKSFIDSYGLSD